VGFVSFPLRIEMSGEVSVLSLCVPPLDPGTRAEASISGEELFAWCELFAFRVYAFVVLNIILPAVLGLVLVGETSVVTRGHKLEGLGYSFLLVGHD